MEGCCSVHLGITAAELMSPLVPFGAFFVVETAAQTNKGNTDGYLLLWYVNCTTCLRLVSPPSTHPPSAADKHHELSGGVLSPLHPAHPLRLVQEAKRAGRGAARVPTQGQHQVQEVRQSVQKRNIHRRCKNRKAHIVSPLSKQRRAAERLPTWKEGLGHRLHLRPGAHRCSETGDWAATVSSLDVVTFGFSFVKPSSPCSPLFTTRCLFTRSLTAWSMRSLT